MPLVVLLVVEDDGTSTGRGVSVTAGGVSTGIVRAWGCATGVSGTVNGTVTGCVDGTDVVAGVDDGVGDVGTGASGVTVYT